jgi:hypothetical protein
VWDTCWANCYGAGFTLSVITQFLLKDLQLGFSIARAMKIKLSECSKSNIEGLW